jgi:hypothetical protein
MEFCASDRWTPAAKSQFFKCSVPIKVRYFCMWCVYNYGIFAWKNATLPRRENLWIELRVGDSVPRGDSHEKNSMIQHTMGNDGLCFLKTSKKKNIGQMFCMYDVLVWRPLSIYSIISSDKVYMGILISNVDGWFFIIISEEIWESKPKRASGIKCAPFMSIQGSRFAVPLSFFLLLWFHVVWSSAVPPPLITPELVFLNVKGAHESIPRNRSPQPYVA